MSIFQDNSLAVDNPQSREEEEDLEEQRRREEELSDLLATGIHAFNYEDSTMNSSVTSVEEVGPNYVKTKGKNDFNYEDSSKAVPDNLSANSSQVTERNYKNVDQQEQLKVLYDVRVREINNLREEFNKFKAEKEKEMTVLKHKVTLSEAELRHCQVTLSNSESLLVEKNDVINHLKGNITSQVDEISNLKKVLEQQNLEICTYKSTVNELQMKLADNNPFNTGARKLNSEELQKAHRDQIIKLETFLQEKSKKVEILEKEKNNLKEDMKKLVGQKNEVEEENNLMIISLSKKLQSAQQQCKDLFLLGEAIKKESDHFKDRIQQYDNKIDLSGDSLALNNVDKDTIVVHIEKLKRMLLDKDVELNTLKTKLKFYNSDLDELFEYRQLLNKMYSCEVKLCNNSEHEELIIFMQRQLQSYQQAIDDRNNQIMSLNMVNKELQEKIEEMLEQTRTDIQNISQKYSLPQLETMSNELKNAEEMINNLKQQLTEKGDDKGKFEKILREKEDLQELVTQERKKFEESVSQTKRELKDINNERNKLLQELSEFKKTELQLTEENEKVKTQLQKICLNLGLSEAEIFDSEDIHDVSTLKSKYGQIHDQLQHVLMHLESMNVKRTNFNIVFKLKKQLQNFLNLMTEQSLEQKHVEDKLEQWDNMLSDFIESLRHDASLTNGDLELKDSIEDVTNAKTMLEGEKFALEYQLKSRTLELEEAKKQIALLNENNSSLSQEFEQSTRSVQKLNDQIQNLKKCLQVVEENKVEVEKQLENTQKQLNEAKQETIDLRKQVREVNENVVRKNLCKELRNVEDTLQQSNNDGSDIFQKCLQAQVLKAEITLRDKLHEENVQKMQKIEDQYKNVLTEKTEMYNKEKEKWKRQEANYRKQFAALLEECGKKMEELENENIKLVKRVNGVLQEHEAFKNNAIISIEKSNKVAADCKKAMRESSTKWATLLQSYMTDATKIEKQQQRIAKGVLKKIKLNQAEVTLIENLYDNKIKQLKEKNLGNKFNIV
ncbi:repetitive organellar protein-like isoform X2 [Zophobas morio]|uniref:repetitive organellar protein-like isoform X2 n=1 Tax=Zophobas morio TaxID=2755281 RepID=UPI00308379FD